MDSISPEAIFQSKTLAWLLAGWSNMVDLIEWEWHWQALSFWAREHLLLLILRAKQQHRQARMKKAATKFSRYIFANLPSSAFVQRVIMFVPSLLKKRLVIWHLVADKINSSQLSIKIYAWNIKQQSTYYHNELFLFSTAVKGHLFKHWTQHRNTKEKTTKVTII